MNETLRSAGSSSGLPSNVQCSDVTTLGGLCSQWSEFTSILRIESKVDALNPTPISEDSWLNEHSELNATVYMHPEC